MTKTYRVYCLWSVGFERNASLQPIWGRKWDDLIDGNSSPWGFLDGQESACNAGDSGLIPGGLWRCPGEGNGNPLQDSCRVSWTEEPGRGHKELDITEVAKEKQNIHISLFYILYHYRLLNVIPVLMEGPCWLSCSCLSQSETPNLSQAPLFGNHKFIFYVSKSASVL